jgi:hypothetical protein
LEPDTRSRTDASPWNLNGLGPMPGLEPDARPRPEVLFRKITGRTEPAGGRSRNNPRGRSTESSTTEPGPSRSGPNPPWGRQPLVDLCPALVLRGYQASALRSVQPTHPSHFVGRASVVRTKSSRTCVKAYAWEGALTGESIGGSIGRPPGGMRNLPP